MHDHVFSDSMSSVCLIHTDMIQTASVFHHVRTGYFQRPFHLQRQPHWSSDFVFRKRSTPSLESSILRIPNPCDLLPQCIYFVIILNCHYTYHTYHLYQYNLREHRNEFKSFTLWKTKQQIHILYRLSCCTFHQVVDSSHHNDAVLFSDRS